MLRSFKTIKTDDFEEFCDWNSEHGIDLNHRQLERGRGTTEAALAGFDQLIVWQFRNSRRTLAEFAIPRGWIEICLADFQEQPIWCGQEIPMSSAAIHLGGKSYECVLPAGGNTFGILVRESMLMDSKSMLKDFVKHSSEDQLVAPRSKSMKRFVSGINSSMEVNAGTNSANEDHGAVYAKCQKLINEVIQNRENCSTVTETKLVDLAKELIRFRATNSLTINDLLEELDVSRRTLELAFRKQLGVTPYQFLIIERLCSARRLLKRSRKSVLEVCIESGFEDASRFASMYSRHFGELPSKTPRNSLPRNA